MEALAKLNNVPTSPRKMRLVADLVRGKRVGMALTILKFTPNHGAIRLEKLLLSAVANWQAKNPDAKLEEADLFIKTLMVDEGRMLKRLRPAPQGRGHRIRKRSNHVTLVVDSFNDQSVTADVVETNEKAN
ncbi:50S ribosomal protein L22 [Algoriphagus aquimarinus]|uniref:Large ribosomal subunit protein uL22 n=1 Tax=Algoriphagus aquimarinus TaxID=237018 RepID=A0A1I0WDI9_9BACT|nr:50S ribosomal protein L22 [Algoriphagus aquimarinus]TXE08885.1 50S ribosomal protein L22 [Algoriphagus aquimarinus]SFA86644.1 LSU ribosomal protein L22P [Algoriphagus aquimarinus]|tara:strand:- start:8794 stop:9186 length:393 start_codon:yes stop_codon:yes gene_type:complete